MHLRELRIEDAPLMLEWMHDVSVTEYLNADFSSKDLEDAECFISAALGDTINNLHYAIASEDDEYMGTVSLKHITNETAEFAIAIRSCAMGKGYAWYAMREILKTGFERMNLKEIYWCVLKNNERALRFYRKHGFCERKQLPNSIIGDNYENKNLYWLVIDYADFKS